jgi:tRNA modification GTPase
MLEDTIAAVATGSGKGGIGIIRISGPKAFAVLQSIFRTPQGKTLSNGQLASHRLTLGTVVVPQTGQAIDQVLVSYMQEPSTFTGEDIVEINAHGGPVVLGAIMDEVLQGDVRLAQPGEFTRRAFLNGKIDLSRAEAVCELINARSQKAAQNALKMLDGVLSKRVGKMRTALEGIMATIEVGIDFPEEIDDAMHGEALADRLEEAVLNDLNEFSGSERFRRQLESELRIVICGKTNVGKSRLANALIGNDRAIVTNVPGTTRDVVSDEAHIGGARLVVVDTAGIREPQEPIEAIGIRKSRHEIQNADHVLLVCDHKGPNRDDELAYQALKPETPRFYVFNKLDLCRPGGRVPEIRAEWQKGDTFPVSAKTGDGISALRRSLAKMISEDPSPQSRNLDLVPNLRQLRSLEAARSALEKALQGLQQGAFPELVMIDLKDGYRRLGTVLGLDTDPDLLDTVFDRFCIGK